MVGGASYGRAVPVTEHMSEAVWQRQLAEVKVPKDPPVPVTVKSSHPGATRGGLLYGWSKDWHHGQWMGLCWFEREYAPGFWVAGGHWPNAGAVLLVQTAQTVGLVSALSDALGPWRRPTALHDPGKVQPDLAVSLAVGGECLADVAQLRGAPEVFGLVASDPTVTRLIDALAADAPAALAAIAAARAATRAQTWELAGKHAPDHGSDAARPLVIDVDATLVTAHSEKEQAAPTFKRGFGFHPLWAFCDHGSEGTGEPLAFLLRRGNAGSNTVADHIADLRQALTQLPGGRRPG